MAKKTPKGKIQGSEPKQVVTPIDKKEDIALQAPTSVVDLFEAVLAKKSIFLLGIALFVILFIVFGSFLMGDRLFLFKDIGSDTINFYYPRLYYIAQYLSEEGIPKWSFHEGMGQNILPLSIGDPFNWLLYMMGKDNLAYGIVWVEFLKIFSAGLAFYAFLRMLKLTYHSSIIGAMAYSFSGFMIVGSGWYIFTTQGLYMALLLLGFEYLFQKNKWWIFAAAVFLIALNSPFDLYLSVVLIFVYSTMRMVDVYGTDLKKYFLTYFLMLAMGIIGVSMSAVMLVSSVDQILNSSRVSGEAAFFETLSSKSMFALGEQKHNLTALARLFSNDLIGDGGFNPQNKAMHFTGWSNYLEAPALYSGLFTLILIPQAIALSRGRKRILFIIGLLMVVIPVLFPYVRYAIWLFSGDYYRTFCLFFTFSLLYVAVQALDLIYTNRKVNLYVLGATLVFWMVMMFMPFNDTKEPGFNVVDGSMRNILIMFLIAHTFVIAGLGFIDYRQTARIAMIGLVALELILVSSYTFNTERPVITKTEYKQKVFYNDFTKDAIAKIKQKDKDFYRISKYYQSGAAVHGSMNDAKVQDYFGTASYQSFNQKNYIRFLGDMDIINRKVEFETRWAPGLQNTPLVQIIASNKYMLAKQQVPNFPGYTLIDSVGDVKILENSFYLPLGFTYDKYLDSATFHKLSKEAGSLKKQIALLKTIVIDNPALAKFSGLQKFDTAAINTNYMLDELSADVTALKSESLKLTKFSHNHISGEVTVSKPKALFLSIPFDPSWVAKVDGKAVKIEIGNLGLMALPLSEGKHSIELIFNPPYWNLSWTVSIIGLLLFVGMIVLNTVLIKKWKNNEVQS